MVKTLRSLPLVKDKSLVQVVKLPQKYMALADAARYLGLSRDTLRDRIERGKLTGKRLGTDKSYKIIVPLDELEASIKTIPTVSTIWDM